MFCVIDIAGTSLVASSLDTDLEEMDESIIRFCFELQSANTNLAVQNAFNLTFDIVAGRLINLASCRMFPQ